ncbi:hypothetical protein OIU76_026439 [Salix suchowensis]|nr:hypothetical protein OIU76_026439 [Salix suchowensis]KAJ6377465.1 hypothetical protein OIU76_026439 [Salix suchowensis]
MPSGSKKRKAAKKKMEKNDNSSINSNNPQGNGDPRSLDEREGDCGEVGSPVSQDQHNYQHPFNEGNGDSEKGGPSPANSSAHQNKPIEGVPGDAEGSHQVEPEDNSAIKIERDSEQNVESKDIIEHVDCRKESHDEDDRSSSSSSSSNESQVFENKSNEANDEEKEKEVVSFPNEVKQIPENEKLVKEVNNNSVLEIIEHVDCRKESNDEDDRSSSSSSSSKESQVFENKSNEANDEEKEKEVVSFHNEVKQIPENEKLVKEVKNNSVLETVSAVYLVNPVVPISETEKFVMESVQVENSEVLEVVESGFEENEDRFLHISNEVVEVSPTIVVPNKNKDKLFPTSDENVGASSNVVGSSVYGNLGKTLASSDSHSTEIGNGADENKDTDALENTVNQSLLSSASQVAERTSWMSCCGLFDVFKGSNR